MLRSFLASAFRVRALNTGFGAGFPLATCTWPCGCLPACSFWRGNCETSLSCPVSRTSSGPRVVGVSLAFSVVFLGHHLARGCLELLWGSGIHGFCQAWSTVSRELPRGGMLSFAAGWARQPRSIPGGSSAEGPESANAALASVLPLGPFAPSIRRPLRTHRAEPQSP